MTILGHVVQKPLIYSRIWKSLGMQGGETLECSNLGLVGDAQRNPEDQNAPSNVSSETWLVRLQMETRTGGGATRVPLWQRTCSFACVLGLSQAEFKSDGLINLTEEISRQRSGYRWLL
ncbi:hypothetical protein H1C71_036270 [Ictidomys tridecemlineatus]|nr:hypothetical protein H1C71_036270 [Ictidomys tridecemlineatus]